MTLFLLVWWPGGGAVYQAMSSDLWKAALMGGMWHVVYTWYNRR